MIRVKDTDVRIVFVSSFYDWPLAGVCVWQGKTCSFQRVYSEEKHDEIEEFDIAVLGPVERLKKWWRRTMFGIMVSWGWHYGPDGKPRKYRRRRIRPKWLGAAMHNTYYFGAPWKRKRNTGVAPRVK